MPDDTQPRPEPPWRAVVKAAELFETRSGRAARVALTSPEAADPGLTVERLAKLAEVDTPTARRALATLAKWHYMERVPTLGFAHVYKRAPDPPGDVAEPELPSAQLPSFEGLD